MKHGSLFSGIGGFDLASQWMGWENIFHCEINHFGQKILKHYWPESISYEDITKTDFTIHRGQLDIITGGFPCQPFSVAGKRKGTEDARHLWPEMLRAIREIKPRYVVGENVGGIVSWDEGLVFDQVHLDLEAEGYEVQAFIFPACAVNAPHRRDRVWFVAHATSSSTGTPRTHRSSESNGSENNDEQEGGGTAGELNIGCGEFLQPTSDPSNSGLQRESFIRGSDELGTNGNKFTPRLLSSNWEKFPTQSPICSRNDGISYGLDGITFPKWRQESIKGYGNAIVPQVAFQIFKSLAL